MKTALTLVLSLLALCAAPAAQAADTPPLVAAYVEQLLKQCGASPAQSVGLIQRLDLNGDKLQDWIVDNSRAPCPTRPKAFADYGQRVTIFLTQADGNALPGFQRDAFGTSIERDPTGRYQLWVTLAGADCGESDQAKRCSRQIVWRAAEKRLDVTPPDNAKTGS